MPTMGEHDVSHSIDLPDALISVVCEAQRVAVMTGAGVSAESGIPTFRDAMTGLWSKFRPEELATPQAFAANPQKVTQWYDERRRMCLECQPNAGHEALAALQQIKRDAGATFTLITQNVDRLHHRAGSEGVLELHGSILEWRCVGCGFLDEETGEPFAQYPPTCPQCGDARRPNVVWFGEMLPAPVLQAADHAAATCDLFLSVGTSNVVYPAAGLIDTALAHDARVIEINLDQTSASRRVHWSLRGSSATVLSRIIEQLVNA